MNSSSPNNGEPSAIAPKPWHICDDCIDPLGTRLAEVVRLYRVPSKEGHIARLMRDAFDETRLPVAVVWLKIHQSVAFANDFQTIVTSPLHDFHRLQFRASQILEGDFLAESKTVAVRPAPIAELVERSQRLEISGSEPPCAGYSEMVLEIREEFYEIFNAIRESVRYLRTCSAIFRAKTNRHGVDAGTIPPAPEFPIRTDFERGIIHIKGTDYPAEPAEIHFVAGIAENLGEYVTGPMLQLRQNCANRRFDQVAKKLFERLPALEDYIQSNGNRGWRGLKK